MWPFASMTRFAIRFLPLFAVRVRALLSRCKEIQRMSRQPIRIAVLHFAHETVTFLKNDTTLDDFVYNGSPARDEALLAHDPRSYMGGFVKVAREFDGV